LNLRAGLDKNIYDLMNQDEEQQSKHPYVILETSGHGMNSLKMNGLEGSPGRWKCLKHESDKITRLWKHQLFQQTEQGRLLLELIDELRLSVF
jgi:hypothetical protein